MAGLLLLYLGLTWIKSMHLFAANRNVYKIRFADVSGLKEGDPVTVFGYHSGNVEHIGLDGVSAIVTINLDRSIEVKADAVAEIRVKELMGGKQVALTPGKVSEPFPAHAFMPGTTSLDFSSAFAKAGEFMDRFDAEEIDTLLRNINRVASSFARLSDEIDSLDTGTIASDVSASAKSLNHLLTSVEQRRMVEKLDESLGKVNQLATRAEETMVSVNKLADRLGEKTLPNAEELIGKVNKMLDDTEGMVKDLKGLLVQMKDKNTIVGQLFYDPAFSQQVDKTLDNLNVTLDHIRTKKIYVTMTLSKGQRLFKEDVEEDRK